jgi:hypothetical protein
MSLLSDIVYILKISYEISFFGTPTITITWDIIYKIDDEDLSELQNQDIMVYPSNAITLRTNKFLYNFHSTSGFTTRMILNNISEIIQKHPPAYHDKLLSYEWYFNGLSFNSYDQCWDVIWTRKCAFIEDTDVHSELFELKLFQ